MKRIPFITLALAALALLAAVLPGITSAFEFTRESFARGEIWRVLTAHLTHFDAAHLRWDVFALLLLGSMAELKSRRDWLVTLAVSAPLITLAVWILQPHFETYRGLSGLDCAAYGVVAGHLLRDGWRERHAPTFALGVLACGGALAKCGYELITGNPFFVGETDAFAPVPLAHLVGVIVGIVGAHLACALAPARGGETRANSHSHTRAHARCAPTGRRGQTNSACENRFPKSKIPAWLPLLNPTKASATSATRSPRP